MVESLFTTDSFPDTKSLTFAVQQVIGTTTLRIWNLTPHPINYHFGDSQFSFPSTGELRLAQDDIPEEPIGSLETVRTVYGGVVGLPDGVRPGDVLIVSTLVGDLWKEGRPEGVYILVPNTGKSCIRDDHGRIVAVTCFIRK